MEEIYMEKTNSNGKRQFYTYTIDGATVNFIWGQIDGKVQADTRTFTEGKNIGKANEKSPEQCCLEDTVTRARKKYESGYEVIKGMDLIEKHSAATVKESNLGVPKPMKANELQKHTKKLATWEGVWVQPKIDGNRGLMNINTGKLYSSGRKEISHLTGLSHEVMKSAQVLKGKVDYIDGELYAPRMIFRDLQTALRRWKNTDKEGTSKLQAAVKYYVFDVVADEPWQKRLEMLMELEENSKVVVVPTYYIHKDQIVEFHNQFIEEGYEGIMIRLPDFHYEQKRSLGIFKYKMFFDEEYEVRGLEPEEHDDDKLGALVLSTSDNALFRARPAMPDDYKAYIWEHPEEFIGRLATVKFQEKDPVSNIPRFPVLTKFRLPEDIT